jgi:hypothetical protein
MSKFRRASNVLAKCRCCGKLTHSSVQGCHGIELCRMCFDSAEQWNAHSDGIPHNEVDKETCPTCAGVECIHEIKTIAKAEGE